MKDFTEESKSLAECLPTIGFLALLAVADHALGPSAGH